MGLPLSLSFSLRGYRVIGVDVNKKLVNDLNAGITYHTEKFSGMGIRDILKREIDEKKYTATCDAKEAVSESKNIIVTVGIPVVDGKYIIDYVKDACTVIARNMKKGTLIIIRSTVIPGTTEELLLPLLERESGMKAGCDFYLAYSSERIAEGNAFDEFENMPTLVGGINDVSAERASELLRAICKAEIYKASCIKVVETSKVFENVQRDVNIAMVQEFARFAESLGIDIFETIRLANTHKRVNLLTPGPGVGGYCIPNAYYYLEPKAEQLGVSLDILRLCRKKNEGLQKFISDKVENLLSKVGKKISTSKIAILGIAMKDYSNDDRISPPIDIIKILQDRGAHVAAYDPAVPTQYEFKSDTQDGALKDADAVLILARQKGIDLDNIKHMAELMNKKPVCLDTKSAIKKEEAEKYGFLYWKI